MDSWGLKRLLWSARASRRLLASTLRKENLELVQNDGTKYLLQRDQQADAYLRGIERHMAAWLKPDVGFHEFGVRQPLGCTGGRQVTSGA